MSIIHSLSVSLLLLLLFPSFQTPGSAKYERPFARQSLNQDGHGGEGSMIPALSPGSEAASVIVLHGLGGNGNEWAYLFLPVSLLSLTYVNFILPTAPYKYVTYMRASMPSWFDIKKLDRKDDISRMDMNASVERVNRIIQGEMDAGVPPERIALMGFSQGGAVALTAFLRSPYKLAGCMAVATWLPLRKDYPKALSPAVRKRKILMLHGTDDQTIDVSYAKLGAQLLKSWDQPVQFIAIKDGPHELFTKDVLTHLEGFIMQEAPGPIQALTKLVKEITSFFDSLTGNSSL